MKKHPLLLASLLTLITACTQLTGPAPTQTPAHSLPTVVALTGQAAFATASALVPTSAPPTETLVPTETPVPTTPLPSATPTVAAGFNDFAEIHFLSPGPMSSLVSPINLQVILIAGESEIVQVDLLGEDGRVLERVLERVQRNLAGNYRSFELSFEIRAVSEKGYIRISSKDDHGRIQALNTMPVLLYSVGVNQVNQPGNMIYERIIYEGLEDGDEIFGGTINLKGRFWPFNEQPAFLELMLPDGEVISSRVLDFNGIETQEFETTLPYKVTEPTLARLSIRQDNPDISISDPDLKKYVYIYTMEVMLYP
ncbi:MAG TPA: hypothetical protein PKE35_18630 [Anaerolineales bacterium]|nr:hypothetical protein [Anaerolineales bacterium]HMX76277.1 hypothetical protein [Anaerolineales bacterium]HNA52833.1 hypothetical protein [Anaerolineales bacterium]